MTKQKQTTDQLQISDQIKQNQIAIINRKTINNGSETYCHIHGYSLHKNNLEDFQCIYFTIHQIAQDSIYKYNFKIIVHKTGYYYTQIYKAIYGLCEDGCTENIKLKRALGLDGFIQSQLTPGLFTHMTKSAY